MDRVFIGVEILLAQCFPFVITGPIIFVRKKYKQKNPGLIRRPVDTASNACALGLFGSETISIGW